MRTRLFLEAPMIIYDTVETSTSTGVEEKASLKLEIECPCTHLWHSFSQCLLPAIALQMHTPCAHLVTTQLFL